MFCVLLTVCASVSLCSAIFACVLNEVLRKCYVGERQGERGLSQRLFYREVKEQHTNDEKSRLQLLCTLLLSGSSIHSSLSLCVIISTALSVTSCDREREKEREWERECVLRAPAASKANCILQQAIAVCIQMHYKLNEERV